MAEGVQLFTVEGALIFDAIVSLPFSVNSISSASLEATEQRWRSWTVSGCVRDICTATGIKYFKQGQGPGRLDA